MEASPLAGSCTAPCLRQRVVDPCTALRPVRLVSVSAVWASEKGGPTLPLVWLSQLSDSIFFREQRRDIRPR